MADTAATAVATRTSTAEHRCGRIGMSAGLAARIEPGSVPAERQCQCTRTGHGVIQCDLPVTKQDALQRLLGVAGAIRLHNGKDRWRKRRERLSSNDGAAIRHHQANVEPVSTSRRVEGPDQLRHVAQPLHADRESYRRSPESRQHRAHSRESPAEVSWRFRLHDRCARRSGAAPCCRP